MTARLMVLNGPNLNLLGIREPHIYGSTTLDAIKASCEGFAKFAGAKLSFHQSNHEGVLVDLIQAARQQADAIIINPAAYSFTSIAVLDAFKIFEGPIFEVHVSNIHARDELHRHSKLSSAVRRRRGPDRRAKGQSMDPYLQTLLGTAAGVVAAAAVTTPAPAQAPVATDSRFAEVNGTRLHYLIAGKGDPVLLLHGYAQTSHMWRPLIAELAKTHTVIAPDLRGFGESAKPDGGYDKKTMAQDVHALAASLGHKRVGVVGHDIGLMVAYAYAAQYPADVDRIALMDAFLPGVGDWTSVWLLRDLWHFHFYGKTPLALVEGRERIYLEHFWNDFAADPAHSVSEADRRFYAAAYAQPGAMKAGFEVFRAFEQDAKDFAGFAKTKLTMPMLVLSGEKAGGQFLIDQGRLVDDNVEGVIVKGSGHWLMDEAPDQVIPKLVAFATAPPAAAAVW